VATGTTTGYDEGREAIPPAYTEYIGRRLLDVLAVKK
jgi:hypothetical protein